ncbi:MAG TPA: MBL fold metallo-hydrolase [Candidatus Binataceae bacterium]|nr:MBL fold metallo-hydrolase [Candidatus Binataceae bacterium]
MAKPLSNGKVVELSFLGTGDAFANGGRFQSGYILEANNYRILMEAGPTSLCAMKKMKVDPASFDLILISHLHGDHYGGLPFLILEYLYESQPKKLITIAGPRRLEARTWRLFNTMFPNTRGDLARLRNKLKFVVLEPDDNKRIGPVRVQTIRTPHMRREASLALRIVFDSKTVVFSGDSGWSDHLVDFAAGADLFLCECTYFESAHLDFHMNYPQLQERRERFDVGRMILTHVGGEVLRRANEIRIETASDGMTVQI